MTATPADPRRAERMFAGLARAFAVSPDYSRAEVARRQTALVERLVRHARRHVPFYREGDRLAPLFRADGAFDMAGWPDVPILTRREARDNEEALRAELLPSDMAPLEAVSTSGSTGLQFNFRTTLVQRVAAEVLANRTLHWRGLLPFGRVAVSKYYLPEGEPIPGIYVIPAGMDFERQVDALRMNGTTHAFATPSVAAGWAEAAGGTTGLRLRAIVLTGEKLAPDVRAKIERGLGAPAIDVYSTSEVGSIANEGPDGVLRVNEELTLLEGPPDGADATAPVPVVTTPFYAYATPLIRYAPGDHVVFAPNASGRARGLRRLAEVLGRTHSLLRMPDGRPFLATAARITEIEGHVDPLAWQIEQTRLDALTLRIVPRARPDDAQREFVRRRMALWFPAHATDVLFVESIAKGAGGKSHEFFASRLDAETLPARA
ncbi:MAG: phenylacetate--CoA ligase family protein [Hyphomicrobiales bacterium]|nr:hypothetical protein [Hyphomicrobiales bacterium]MDE2018459.1 phenylacetate--CoA ligase family protein [Hyphomicrobiales bacterium]